MAAVIAAMLIPGYGFAEITLKTGALDFLDTVYVTKSQTEGTCSIDANDVSYINSVKIRSNALPFECFWGGYAEIPAELAIAEYARLPDEKAYQVFYSCPKSDSQQFPSMFYLGVIIQGRADNYLLFFNEAFVQYSQNIKIDRQNANQFYECKAETEQSDTSYSSESVTRTQPIQDQPIPDKIFTGAVSSTDSIFRVIKDVNFRSGPGTTFPVIGVFSNGEILQANGFSRGWYRFNKSGRNVYVYKNYLQQISGN